MSIHPGSPRPTVSADHCAACGKRLIGKYYIFVDRPERYCPTCIATRPRCDCCGAPLGPDAWQLHDGRSQCHHCHSTAVYELALAQQLYDETVVHVVAQLDLKLQVGVEFRMVDAPTLQAVRAQDSSYVPNERERTLGLYQRQGRIRAIYLLYGLPRLLFRTTIAHEYAHAWQGECCPLLTDPTLREGFAEWVAYRHLAWLGCTKAAERMRHTNHPYRVALDHVLTLEEQLGTRGLIDYMRQAE